MANHSYNVADQRNNEPMCATCNRHHPPYADTPYVVYIHGRDKKPKPVYIGGDDDGLMYSYVNAIEWTLERSGGTADIEIVQYGQGRWIDYRHGRRIS